MTALRRRSTGRPTVTVTATALAAVAALAGCATDDGSSSAAGRGTASATSADAREPGTGTRQENAMRIQLTVGDQQATASLEDNAAARDLASMLPVTTP